MASTLIPVVILMVATLVILITGLVAMIKGDEFNKKYGNKLMMARVVCQALAIITLFVLVSGK